MCARAKAWTLLRNAILYRAVQMKVVSLLILSHVDESYLLSHSLMFPFYFLSLSPTALTLIPLSLSLFHSALVFLPVSIF